MSNYITGPNTFQHLLWSAPTFRQFADDTLSAAARAPEFRAALLSGSPNANTGANADGSADANANTDGNANAGADWPALVRYVNQWGCRIPPRKADGIAAAVANAAPHLAALSASALEFDDLRCSTLDVIAHAFDGLTQADGVGPTAASAILTALNPQLFVSWGAGIKNAYFPDDKPNGAAYAQFLTVMRMAALSIAADARAQHGIADPAGHLSAALGINPPFTLAKFIDEYNWLTIERGLTCGASPAA